MTSSDAVDVLLPMTEILLLCRMRRRFILHEAKKEQI